MKNDYFKFFVVVVILMFLIVITLLFYYYSTQKQECLRSPLVYGAKELSKKYDYEFVGNGFFKVPSGFQIPTITFNSTEIHLNN